MRPGRAPQQLLFSTSLDSENICIIAVVIAELELGNTEGQIYAAHFVQRADGTAFEN
jgi:hypothetical protein